MNEQIIAIKVITKPAFSMISILCEKLPLDNNTNIAIKTPIMTTGTTRIEWKNAAIKATAIIPIATNEVK